MTETTVLFDSDTEFGHYEVVDTLYAGRPARVLYSGNRQAAQSGVAHDDKPELLFDYNERFMELVRGLKPACVLLIGGGAFTLPVAIAAELPDIRLDIVEIDGALLDIGQKYFGFQPSRLVTVHIGEGAEYLAQTRERYDLILVDVFTHAIVPAEFQTNELAHNLAQALSDKGTVAMNIIAGYYGERAAALRRQIVAFQSAFRRVQLFPASPGQSLWLPQNFVLTAQQQNRSLQPYLRHQELKLPLVSE